MMLRKPAAAKRIRQTRWIDAGGDLRPSRIRVSSQKNATRMNRTASAPAGSSPEAVGLPTPADPVLPACGLVMSSVDRIAMVVKTKFSKLTSPSATIPTPASTLIGTMRSSLLPPRYTSMPLSTATARMSSEIDAKNTFARRVIGVITLGCRNMAVDIN
jgi:hypothetical protein